MAKSVIVDTGALVTLLDRRQPAHRWAVALAQELQPPWLICEAVLTETFFVLDSKFRDVLFDWLRRDALHIAFSLANELEPVLALMEKYADVPMSLADACIVRVTETVADPLVLTTDYDFRIYRRHSRQVIPCRMP